MLVLLVVSACGGDPDGPVADLGSAACADLRDGLTITQIVNAGLENGLSRKRIAAALILGTENDCPEFKDELAKTPVPAWVD